MLVFRLSAGIGNPAFKPVPLLPGHRIGLPPVDINFEMKIRRDPGKVLGRVLRDANDIADRDGGPRCEPRFDSEPTQHDLARPGGAAQHESAPTTSCLRGFRPNHGACDLRADRLAGDGCKVVAVCHGSWLIILDAMPGSDERVGAVMTPGCGPSMVLRSDGASSASAAAGSPIEMSTTITMRDHARRRPSRLATEFR